MNFQPFLLLVLSVYGCYYLLLICFERFNRTCTVAGKSDETEFVIASKTEPVRVTADTIAAPKYQLEEEVAEEPTEKVAASSNGIVETTDNKMMTHDLGLEIISAPAAIPVASPKFIEWFKLQLHPRHSLTL